MAILKWTTELTMNDVTVASVPHIMEVDRKWDEVVVQGGNKARSVQVAGQGKLVFLQVQARNARKESIFLEAGKKKIPLNRPVLFTRGISGISGANQDSYVILHSAPKALMFRNKSQSPLAVEIHSAWQIKNGK
ncbi:MAG: hypothetical protein JXR49_12655 [Acidobacteria bacterium]|nr:hypothetical protein [Acidobacteriota bacterium]